MSCKGLTPHPQVRGWLKARGEETLSSRSDIGDSLDSAQAIQEQHDKFDNKAKVICSETTLSVIQVQVFGTDFKWPFVALILTPPSLLPALPLPPSLLPSPFLLPHPLSFSISLLLPFTLPPSSPLSLSLYLLPPFSQCTIISLNCEGWQIVSLEPITMQPIHSNGKWLN